MASRGERTAESRRRAVPGRRRLLVLACLAALAATVAGCGALGYTSSKADKQKGRELFIKGANGKPACGSCHILADAGTTGTIGPNLDAAFQQALKVGMTEGTIRNVVRGQIAYAIDQPSTGSPGMPKRLVTGDDARDVAAYVAGAVVKDTAGGSALPAPSSAPTPAPSSAPNPAPATGGGSAQTAAGKKVFTDAGCGACHTLKDAGATATVGPDLDKVAADAKTAKMAVDAYVLESIVNPNAYVVPGFPKGVMPPDFKTQLTAKQIAALVAYVVKAAAGS